MNTVGKKAPELARELRAQGLTLTEIADELRRRKMRGSLGSIHNWISAKEVAKAATHKKAPKAPRPPIVVPPALEGEDDLSEVPLGYRTAIDGQRVWGAKLASLATDPDGDAREGKAVVDVLSALARMEREHRPTKPIDPDNDPKVQEGGKIALGMLLRGLDELLKARES